MPVSSSRHPKSCGGRGIRCLVGAADEHRRAGHLPAAARACVAGAGHRLGRRIEGGGSSARGVLREQARGHRSTAFRIRFFFELDPRLVAAIIARRGRELRERLPALLPPRPRIMIALVEQIS